MSSIRLEPLLHRGNHCIAIRGRLNPLAEKVVRAFPNRQFSRTQSCWYVVYSEKVLEELGRNLIGCQSVEISEAFKPGCRNEKSLVKIISIALPEGYHEMLIRVRYSEATVKTYESQM